MASPIEEIKSRLDITDVVQGYLRLQKAGVNFRGLCPFHSEKTPSFFVSPSRQSWHCFGSCDTGGDVITFVERIEGIEFRDALRLLADRAGIKLKTENPEARSERDKLFAILDEATSFYVSLLQSAQGRPALDYLRERGLRDETMKLFRLGYAPNDWRELVTHLTTIGFAPADIEKAGLIIGKPQAANDGTTHGAQHYYDRFRHRITFPLFDLGGKVIGFTGRVMPGGEEAGGKYVNTPQTLLFDKGRLLYGLHASKTEIRRAGHAALVEGQMDFLMSYQAGVQNVVATSGTAFTGWHLGILRRYTDSLRFAFDMDSAGVEATKRAIDLALEADFAVSVIRLSSGKDAADLVRANPPDWVAAAAGAVSLLEFYFAAAFARHQADTPEGKRLIANELLPVVKRVPHTVEQAHWLGVLAEGLGVREEDLRREIARVALRPLGGGVREAPRVMPASAVKLNRKERLLEELTLYIRHFPALKETVCRELPGMMVSQLDALAEREDLAIKSDFLDDDEATARRHTTVLAQALREWLLHEELAQLQLQLRASERVGKLEEVEALTKKIHMLTERLRQGV
ncbi:MAG: DNA primase [bacterium]|nr:DNA primase [bacterium]MDZ4296236.1 DNA primase [Patescibacteria group bacterium]